MKPIFHLYLDIDGVCNSDFTKDRVNNYLGIDNGLIANLKNFIQELEKNYEVRIILISTWRNYWYKTQKERQDAFANRLDEALESVQLSIYDRIPNDANRKTRGKEVLDYMATNPCDNYFILDDEDYSYVMYSELEAHKIFINGSYGFTKKRVQMALYKLGVRQ